MNRSAQPLEPSAGVGLKAEHYSAILEQMPVVGFFEIHAENYMGNGGPPHRYLEAIRDRYPISMHGVGLNLGGTAPLSMDHLARLKTLIERYQPSLFSEHLAWTATPTSYLNDLLPVPCTASTLDHICARVDLTQNYLKTQLLLENPATYVRYAESEIPEPEFLALIAERTGCGLLLDVNNVYVSAVNHGFDPAKYLQDFAVGLVREIHLAGHFESLGRGGDVVLIDAHDSPVKSQVWLLYRQVLHRLGPVPTLIEWDNEIPQWATLFAEAQRAERLIREAARSMAESRDEAVAV